MPLPKLNGNLALGVVSLCVMMLITLSGCSASKHGKLTSNKDVAQAFQGYQILPNHKYYYRGVYSKPTVIVGINQNYKLNLKMWVAIDPESKDFRILIDRVNFQGMGNPVQPWGFTILDRDGKEVGVWYSALRAAAVEIEENGQIVKLFPMGLAAVGDQRQ